MTFRPRYFHSRQNRISYDNELCNDFYPITQHIVLFYPVSTLLFLLEKMKSIQTSKLNDILIYHFQEKELE